MLLDLWAPWKKCDSVGTLIAWLLTNLIWTEHTIQTQGSWVDHQKHRLVLGPLKGKAVSFRALRLEVNSQDRWKVILLLSCWKQCPTDHVQATLIVASFFFSFSLFHPPDLAQYHCRRCQGDKPAEGTEPREAENRKCNYLCWHTWGAAWNETPEACVPGSGHHLGALDLAVRWWQQYPEVKSASAVSSHPCDGNSVQIMAVLSTKCSVEIKGKINSKWLKWGYWLASNYSKLSHFWT